MTFSQIQVTSGQDNFVLCLTALYWVEQYTKILNLIKISG